MRILNSTTFITVLAYAFSGLAMASDESKPEETNPKTICRKCGKNTLIDKITLCIYCAWEMQKAKRKNKEN